MAHMKPQAQWFSSEDAWEYCVSEETKRERPEGADASDAGWYSRLSASGYLDCTEWTGPFETEEDALRECMEIWEVDEEGEIVD